MNMYKEMKLFSAFGKKAADDLEEFTYATEYINEVLVDRF